MWFLVAARNERQWLVISMCNLCVLCVLCFLWFIADNKPHRGHRNTEVAHRKNSTIHYYERKCWLARVDRIVGLYHEAWSAARYEPCRDLFRASSTPIVCVVFECSRKRIRVVACRPFVN